MANSNKQTELNSTEESNFKMRRSFSWDRAFFTSDGFLADEELSSIIEGGGNDVKHELQKIEELESLEAKMFQEIEASTKKSNKVTRAGGPGGYPVKTPPKRSSPLSGGGSGGSPGNNVKTLAKRSMTSKNGKANADSPSKTPPGITTKTKVGSFNAHISRTSPASPVSPGSSGSKTGKANADSPAKTPPGITTKNKVVSVNTRASRASPASPVSPGSSGSSSSTFSVNQRPKWNGSVRCRSSVNEKPSATNGRRNDDRKISKPAVDIMPKSQSSISLKTKPPPVIAQPSSPSAKPTFKKHLTSQTSDPHSKQPATSCTHGSNARKLPSTKTIAAHNTGLKPNSLKATAKKQSSGKENIIIISPEILDLKGKLNALKMEISMQKDRCKKMVRVET